MATSEMSPGIPKPKNSSAGSTRKSIFAANTGSDISSRDDLTLEQAMSKLKSVEDTSIKPAPTSSLTSTMTTPTSSNVPSLKIPETDSELEQLEEIRATLLDLGISAFGTAPNPITREQKYRSGHSPIPGFSQARAGHISSYIKSQVAKEMQLQRTKLLETLDQKSLQNNEELVSMLAKHLNVTTQAPQGSQEDDVHRASTPNPQPTAETAQASTKILTDIRPQDIGYFYPDYQSEKEDASPVPSVGKYVYFRDVYMFVDWVKEFAAQGKNVKSVLSSCLRGSALIWYLVELSEEDRTRLYTSAGLDEWYELLIKKFKLDSGIASARLMSSSSVYTLASVKHTPPSEWAQYMLQLANATTYFPSTYSRLIILWNQLDPELAVNIRKPTEQTTLSEFLEEMDHMAPVWYSIAHRRSSHARSQPQQQYRMYYGNRHLQNHPVNDGQQQAQSSGVASGRDDWWDGAVDQGTYEEDNGHAYAF